MASGVDIVVAQGYEAGGHTGEIASMVLIPEIVDAVDGQVPVLAAGGIGCGRQIAAALALGAVGVWMGSAWLITEEYSLSTALPALREALLTATSSDTVRSRIYSGKPARLLKNRWTEAWAEPGAPEPLPMPLQNLLVSEAHQRLMRSGQPDVLPMPVGQIVGRMTEVRPVAELVKTLMQETAEALSRLDTIPLNRACPPAVLLTGDPDGRGGRAWHDRSDCGPAIPGGWGRTSCWAGWAAVAWGRCSWGGQPREAWSR